MNVRFDHAMVGVADLDAAAERYRALGFEVRAGGEHAGLGTANLIVPFADGRYVELIGIRDVAAARRGMPDGERFAALVEAHAEVPLIFVLAAGSADDLDGVRSRLAAADLGTAEPVRMERRQPSGKVVGFSVLGPGAGPWRRGYPSFIDWGETPHPAATAGAHPNGARELAGLDVAVDALSAHVRHYRALGLEVELDAARDVATTRIGDLRLTFAGPASGAAAAELEARGPGIVAIELTGEQPLTVDATPARPFALRVTTTAP